MSEKRPLPRVLGLLGVAFFVSHATALALRQEASHALWSCHLANLVLAAGLALRRADLCSVSFLWLLIGLPMWAMDVTLGADVIPTTTLTHVGGFVLAVLGIRAYGFSRGAWWKAAAGMVALWGVARLLAPRSANVNFSGGAWYGWETDYVPYAVYVLGLLAAVSGIFRLAEWLIVRRATD